MARGRSRSRGGRSKSRSKSKSKSRSKKKREQKKKKGKGGGDEGDDGGGGKGSDDKKKDKKGGILKKAKGALKGAGEAAGALGEAASGLLSSIPSVSFGDGSGSGSGGGGGYGGGYGGGGYAGGYGGGGYDDEDEGYDDEDEDESPPYHTRSATDYDEDSLEESYFPTGVITVSDLEPQPLSLIRNMDMNSYEKLLEFGFTEKAAEVISYDLNNPSLLVGFATNKRRRIEEAFMDLNYILKIGGSDGNDDPATYALKKKEFGMWFKKWMRHDTLLPVREPGGLDEYVGRMEQFKREGFEFIQYAIEEEDKGVPTTLRREWKMLGILLISFRDVVINRFDTRSTNPLHFATARDILVQCGKIAFATHQLFDGTVEKKKIQLFATALKNFVWQWCKKLLGAVTSISLHVAYHTLEASLSVFNKHRATTILESAYESLLLLSDIKKEHASHYASLVAKFALFGKEMSDGIDVKITEPPFKISNTVFTELFVKMGETIADLATVHNPTKADAVISIIYEVTGYLYAKRYKHKDNIQEFMRSMKYWMLHLLNIMTKKSRADIEYLTRMAQRVTKKIESPQIQSSWRLLSAALIESLRLNDFSHNSEVFRKLGNSINETVFSSSISQPIGSILDFFIGSKPEPIDPFPFPGATIDAAFDFLHK